MPVDTTIAQSMPAFILLIAFGLGLLVMWIYYQLKMGPIIGFMGCKGSYEEYEEAMERLREEK